MLSKVLYGRKGCDFDSVIKPFVRQALCTGSGKKESPLAEVIHFIRITG